MSYADKGDKNQMIIKYTIKREHLLNQNYKKCKKTILSGSSDDKITLKTHRAVLNNLAKRLQKKGDK